MKYTLAMFLVLLIASCESPSRTIWSAEIPSKDGQWLLSASTIDTVGPGINNLSTVVYIERPGSRKVPLEILGISNDSVFPEGNTRLSFEWTQPTELQITYYGKAKVDFQVTKVAGFDVSVKHADHYAAQQGVQADVHEKP